MDDPQQPKGYPRAANVAPFPSPIRSLLASVAGPFILSALVAGSGTIVGLYSDNLLLNERLGVVAQRLADLEAKSQAGSRYTGEMAEADKAEFGRKLEAVQGGLTELRILVARTLAERR